jgi:mevalonate kinase
MEQFNAKVLLFGEYAVLHNGMALVIPCDKYQGHLDFYESSEHDYKALLSNKYLKKFCDFVASHMDEKFMLEVKIFEQELKQGLFFRSTIPQGYGLGSSGALVAAIVLRYLAKAKKLKNELMMPTLRDLKELKKSLGKLESYFHGVSSGLDPLSIILNEPILYKNKQDIVTAELPKKTTGSNDVVFLLDTKFPRTTSNMMGLFNTLHSKADFKGRFQQYVVQNNNGAIQNFLENDTERFYRSMHDLSAFQLQYMKDFFPEPLHKEVAGGLDNGDYFLKLCGAGGGGFMLGFTQNWEITQKKLENYELEKIYSY